MPTTSSSGGAWRNSSQLTSPAPRRVLLEGFVCIASVCSVCACILNAVTVKLYTFNLDLHEQIESSIDTADYEHGKFLCTTVHSMISVSVRTVCVSLFVHVRISVCSVCVSV